MRPKLPLWLHPVTRVSQRLSSVPWLLNGSLWRLGLTPVHGGRDRLLLLLLLLQPWPRLLLLQLLLLLLLQPWP